MIKAKRKRKNQKRKSGMVTKNVNVRRTKKVKEMDKINLKNAVGQIEIKPKHSTQTNSCSKHLRLTSCTSASHNLSKTNPRRQVQRSRETCRCRTDN